MSERTAKQSVHAMIALYAPDQLLQRVACALSQVWVVADGVLDWMTAEKYLSYYDIFVRHANGNLRDIMREVSYHPAMGLSLIHI